MYRPDKTETDPMDLLSVSPQWKWKFNRTSLHSWTLPQIKVILSRRFVKIIYLNTVVINGKNIDSGDKISQSYAT